MWYWLEILLSLVGILAFSAVVVKFMDDVSGFVRRVDRATREEK